MINEYELNPNLVDPNLRKDETVVTALSNDDVIAVLNGLIQTCKDGQEGFKQAAEGVNISELKTAFYEFGQQRAQFVGELQGLVRELGGDPEKSGTILGSLHRGWMDIKSVITGNDEAAILNEAERGEDIAKSNYQQALDNVLPANVRNVIEEQLIGITNVHDRVKIMRDAANRSHKSASTNK